MKVTGYQLREARKQWELRRDTSARAFNGALKKFEDETKDTPREIVEQFLTAERAIASLEVAQMQYNLAVHVDVDGKKITLAEAVKLIGGEARAEKMWRTASGPVPERYGYQNSDERDPTKLIAKSTITAKEATSLASSSAKRAGAYRAAIAVGNAREVEIEGLDTSLLD